MAESTQGQNQGGSLGSPTIDDDARKEAERHGVDLKNVKGTGENGRITMKDVEAARSAAR